MKHTTPTSALSFQNVSHKYPGAPSSHYALCDVSFDIGVRRSTAVVGESGSGKTTLAKLAMGLLMPTHGDILFHGLSISAWTSTKKQRKHFRKSLQMIFQDPEAALNPKMNIESHLNEALHLHFPTISPSDRAMRIQKSLQEVSLSEDVLHRYSFEISGGQKQRLIIARALLIEPTMLILDEPLASLDASLRKSTLSLLQRLRTTHNMTYMYVTHDLSTVPHISDHVVIMYRGLLVEEGSVESLYSQPLHPYTQMLFNAVPTPDPIQEKKKARLSLSEKSSPLSPKEGCVFAHRCPFATDMCRRSPPPLVQLRKGEHASHTIRCHYPEKCEQEPLFK